jgi:hypothetical protein
VINIDPNVTVANFALYDTTRTLDTTVVGSSGNAIQLDPVRNGVIRESDPATLVYLGYGFRNPKPGKWSVTLHTTEATPAGGADYAIAAQFNGGATLRAKTNTLLPELDEPVTISANLTADGSPITLDSAQVQLRRPDGVAETFDMTIAGNTATYPVKPVSEGIYGLEVRATAHTQDNMEIDRAVFLTFEVQPPGHTFSMKWSLVLLGLICMIGLISWTIRRRRRKNVGQRRM